MKSRYEWLKKNGTEVMVDNITFVVYRRETATDSWYCYYWKLPIQVENKLLNNLSSQSRINPVSDLKHEITTAWYENGQLVWGWDMNHLWHKADKGYGKNAVDCDWLFRELCETVQDLTELIG